MCIVLTFSQCAARYSTAGTSTLSQTECSEKCKANKVFLGGAYHYATFLCPPQYRRYCGYLLGWLNYLGWIFTHAATVAIVSTCTLALINLCNPSFDVSTRWHLFLVYLALTMVCWLINIFGLRGIGKLEIMGCRGQFGKEHRNTC